MEGAELTAAGLVDGGNDSAARLQGGMGGGGMGEAMSCRGSWVWGNEERRERKGKEDTEGGAGLVGVVGLS